MADIPEINRNVCLGTTCPQHAYSNAYMKYRNSWILLIFTSLVLIIVIASTFTVKIFIGYIPKGFIPASIVIIVILLSVLAFCENLITKFNDKMHRIKFEEKRRISESQPFEMDNVSRNPSRQSRESSRRNSPRSERRHIKRSRSEQRNIAPLVNESGYAVPSGSGSRRITPPASELGRTETPRSELRRIVQPVSEPRRTESSHDTPAGNEQRFVLSGPCTIVINPT